MYCNEQESMKNTQLGARCRRWAEGPLHHNASQNDFCHVEALYFDRVQES